MTSRIRVGMCVLVALLGAEHEASASSVACPAVFINSKTYVVDTTPNAVCTMTGSANLLGAGDPFLLANPTWEFVDHSDNPGGELEGALNITSATPSGVFTISALAWSAYSSLALALQDGNNAPGPRWAVFLLPANVLTGTWAIYEYDGSGIQKAKNLSHAILYGLPSEETELTHAPEPASILLLGGGLAAMASRLRRRANKA